MTTPVSLRRTTWRDVLIGMLLGLCCFVVYNANGRAISAGDAIPARYLPFAILKHGTLRLDPVASVTAQGRKMPADPTRLEGAFWMLPTSDGHRVSLYSVVLPVVITPLYVPAVAYLDSAGWTDANVDYVGRVMEKLVASLITSLSASILFLALRRRVDTRVAVLLTVAYALGSSAWVISSQALWQHGLAQLLIAIVLLCVTGPATTTRVVIVGLCLGVIVGNRPPDVVLAGALGVYGLYWAGRHATWLVVSAALPMALVLVYNVTIVGSLIGGYGLLGKMGFLRNDAWWVSWGIGGLLVSPARGLLVFSPFLLFLVLAWRHRPATREERLLSLAIVVAVAVQVVAYARSDWRAGYSWGPRFLTDLVPLLIWLLAPIVAALGRKGRVVFVGTVMVAIAIEAVGAFYYTGASDEVLYSIPAGPTKLRPAFAWRNAPYVASLAHGRAPADLWQRARGSFDRLESNGVPIDTVEVGQVVEALGWTLVGREAPLQVAVTIDGDRTLATRTFFDRPDVRQVVPDAGPAGWRIALDTTELTPGQHRLSVLAWTSEHGSETFIGTWPISIRAPQHGLDAAFQLAAARILEHQDSAGFWLTAFTTTTRSAQPGHEMNTYLTSLMVDLLQPVVGAGLGFGVERARQHLTAQIEPGGLVRYHGLPTSDGIGTLGCRITPDTDDTALVWRLAPPADRAALSAALSTIESYRRPDGLYRTWLAPRAGYECLDPGDDPNPADLTIQMHLLQLLATERPDAAAALCQAVRRDVGQSEGWVYYELAPLVPMLRLPELARAGCALELPASRMRTTVPGQEVWLTVAQLLGQLSGDEGPRPRRADVVSVLERLAADEFALVREHPPLLYHNDLSATVPRYYWSEDVGYALWLRLAAAGAAAGR